MKQNLRVFFLFLLFKVKFNEPQQWGVISKPSDPIKIYTKIKYTFEFYPRKGSIIFLTIILLPIIILWCGISSLGAGFKDLFKIQTGSSYQFIVLKEVKKPSKWSCYKKF